MTKTDKLALDQINSQADHIMRMYEPHEIKEMMIRLAHEWYMKGVNLGMDIVVQHTEDVINDRRAALQKAQS